MKISEEIKKLQDRIIELEAELDKIQTEYNEMAQISINGLKMLTNYKSALQVAYSAMRIIENVLKPEIKLTVDPVKREITRIINGAITDMSILLSLTR